MRRRKGDGTLMAKKDARGRIVSWCAVLDLGWGEDGKRHRRWFRGKRQQDVLDALGEAKHQARAGTLPAPGKYTVAKWMETWLRDVVVPTVRPSTRRIYEGFIRGHIIPVLGRKALDKLTVADGRHLLNSREGLSQQSKAHLRAVLRAALNRAINDGLIPSQRNVAAQVGAVKVAHKPRKAWSADQAKHFLASVAGDPLEPVYTLLSTQACAKARSSG